FTSKKWQCDPTWTGRSPRFVTSSRAVARPAFSSIGSESRKYSPGIIVTFVSLSADRTVNGDQLRAVRERALDLDFRNHLRDAVHDAGDGQNRRAEAHDFGDRLSVANH